MAEEHRIVAFEIIFDRCYNLTNSSFDTLLEITEPFALYT